MILFAFSKDNFCSSAKDSLEKGGKTLQILIWGHSQRNTGARGGEEWTYYIWAEYAPGGPRSFPAPPAAFLSHLPRRQLLWNHHPNGSQSNHVSWGNQQILNTTLGSSHLSLPVPQNLRTLLKIILASNPGLAGRNWGPEQSSNPSKAKQLITGWVKTHNLLQDSAVPS